MKKEKEILKRLEQFEKEYGFEVILAVESGSRGWGFASEDSDYDVRFVYKYPKERYLHIKRPKDCINRMEGDLDFEGFDIYKFYDLLSKSNMNIIDWVMQDVIYIDKMRFKGALIENIKVGFDRRTYCAHNYGLAKSNYFKYFNNPSPDEPTVKRYIYCLKALFSADFCLTFGELAPIKFPDLVNSVCEEEEQRKIMEMIELKKNTKEKKQYRNMEWEAYIKNKINANELPEKQDNDTAFTYQKLLNEHLLYQLGIGYDSTLKEKKMA